jgi:hypothetical protein
LQLDLRRPNPTEEDPGTLLLPTEEDPGTYTPADSRKPQAPVSGTRAGFWRRRARLVPGSAWHLFLAPVSAATLRGGSKLGEHKAALLEAAKHPEMRALLEAAE